MENWLQCSINPSLRPHFPRVRRRWLISQMLKYRGADFVSVADFFGLLRGVLATSIQLSERLNKAAESGEVKRSLEASLGVTGEHGESLDAAFLVFRRLLQEADMEVSIDSLDRVLRLLKERTIDLPKTRSALEELHGRIRDELSHMELWLLTREERRFLISDPFGPDISTKFPSARDDIEEAGKCLSFGRGTACVFHLMRVMEVGLRALGRSLNDPNLDPSRNPTWHSILKKCDDEPSKPLGNRAPEWRDDDAFFSAAAAQLHAVKDAWRNPTMHIERKYLPDEAEEVWNAVRAFMRQLARKLSEF
jgi:hypothetical protein